MKKLIGVLLSFIVCLAIGSCNIINPDEPIPTFLQIDSVNVLSVAPGTHGSVSENISDVWVYVNNTNVGNFELPASVPFILEDGADSASLTIFAGIKVNGFSFNRRRYIFYEPYRAQIAKQEGKTINLTPVVEYRTTNNYELIEDFETGNSFVKSSGADTSIVRTSDPNYVFEGASSGLIRLGGTVKTANSVTVQSFQLPKDKESFLELDYKCDLPFTIEMQLTSPNNPVIISELLSLKERANWNKIYISLTDIATQPSISSINFIIKSNLPVDKKTGFVAIDNFKIISQ